jgi:hypothetical protein
MGEMADMVIGDIVDPLYLHYIDDEEEEGCCRYLRATWPKKLKNGIKGMKQAQNIIEEQMSWRKNHSGFVQTSVCNGTMGQDLLDMLEFEDLYGG